MRVMSDKKKVVVNFIIQVSMYVDKGVKTSDIFNEIEYDIKDTTGKANIVETEMVDYEEITA